MSELNPFLRELTPTQEHFLKKYLLENRLDREIRSLSDPDSLQKFGKPFRSLLENPKEEFPLLRYFFDNYISQFPFITNNSPADQIKFWQDTVQPFIESVNSKQLSNSNDRRENVTKRKQINLKFTSGLLLFYNSMIITDKDMQYLEGDHLKPSDIGKLDKLKAYKTPILQEMHDLHNPDDENVKNLKFINNLNINIVGVNVVHQESEGGWFYARKSTHHYEFIIQVIKLKRDGTFSKHYVERPYHEFKILQNHLKSNFPGIMNIQTSKLPDKFKHDLNSLVKEKLRLALRGYLVQLLEYPEIIRSNEFQNFITLQKFHKLSPQQSSDYSKRLNHERQIISAQFEFQKQLSSIMIDFSKKFDDFKIQLIKDPTILSKIFEEIGANDNLDNLSPLLSIFVDWCKIELSSTIFQIFLSQDNSNELLNNFRKFHRLFPYGITYNILRFTNPMSIISKIIGLFLIPIPGTKNKSLLSILFVMVLDEDLSGYELEISEILDKLKDYPHFTREICKFIDEKLIETDLNIDENIEEILNNTPNLNNSEKQYLIDNASKIDIFNYLKQLYQLKVRQNDKLILKSLWEEPELTKLLRNFLIIFYQPLIKLLSKSKMHVFFKDFQNFNNELISLLVKLNDEELYYLSSVEVFNKLMTLLDDHIIIFWRFVHNLYKNDNDKLFFNIIKWIENFLVKLRLKYTDTDKVKISLNCSKKIDQDIFTNQLNQIIDKTLTKRQLFKDHYDLKQNSTKTPVDNSDKIENNWEKLHNDLNKYDTEFGLHNEDIDEYNFEINNKDVEFKKKLDKINNILIDTSELDKFDSDLTLELNRIFKDI